MFFAFHFLCLQYYHWPAKKDNAYYVDEDDCKAKNVLHIITWGQSCKNKFFE